MSYGGWLYKCGHFHPSTFMQIAQCKGECDDCKYAKELLEEAKHLRRRKVSQEPKFELKFNRQTSPKKRIADCQMGY